jgi:hypothetical protein
MKAIILSVLCIALLSFSQAPFKKKLKKISVSGTVTSTSNYCGGARPSDEMIAQLATPRPKPNAKIYIKSGEVNSFESKVIRVLKTDANGNFHTKLLPGKYLIVDSTKMDMTYYNMLLKTYKTQTAHYEAIDTICLKEWYMKPNLVFEVAGTEVKGVKVNFHKTCHDVPCAQFTGPYPQ